MNRTLLIGLLSFVVAISTNQFVEADPSTVGWRQNGQGVYEAANPPLKWSTSQNVVWSTKMPAESNACPILVGNRLFVNAEPSTLICVDADNGKILWQRDNGYDQIQDKSASPRDEKKIKELQARKRELDKQKKELVNKHGRNWRSPDFRREVKPINQELEKVNQQMGQANPLQMPPTHNANGYSSPTPTSDGKYVYVLYGTGMAACYDLDGNRKWITLVERSSHRFGQCSSPLLMDGILVMHINDIHGIDAATGKQLWKVSSRTRWGSPLGMKVGGESLAVVADGKVVRVSDGQVVAGPLNSLDYNSALVVDNKIYFVQAKASAHELKNANGKIAESRSWNGRLSNKRYYGSPLLVDGLLYGIDQGGELRVLEAATGKEVYTRRISELGGGTVYPSATKAGNHIFISIDNGTTVVIEPGREYKQVAKNKLDGFRSTPFFSGNRMFIRTHRNLYCIADTAQASNSE